MLRARTEAVPRGGGGPGGAAWAWAEAGHSRFPAGGDSTSAWGNLKLEEWTDAETVSGLVYLHLFLSEFVFLFLLPRGDSIEP